MDIDDDDVIVIGDDVMCLLGRKIGDNLFWYNNKVLRMIRTHQTESISYYVVDKLRRDIMGLTPKQEIFAQGIFRGLSQKQAYEEAFKCDNMKDTTITNNAYMLLKKRDITARITELQEKVASKNIMSEIELQEFWTQVVKENNEMKDKLKASELLGKNKKMFIDRVEHSGKVEMPAILITK